MRRGAFLAAIAFAASVALLEGGEPPDVEAESRWLQRQGGVRSLYERTDPEKEERRAVAADVPESGGKAVPEAGPRRRERTRDDLLDEVDLGWARPEVFERVAEETDGEAEDEVRRFLEGVFIPRVEFRDVPLSEVVETLAEMKIPMGVVINRADVGHADVEEYCRRQEMPVLLKIPYDEEVAAG